jgi:excinuclease UvrABC nuclease subunit
MHKLTSLLPNEAIKLPKVAGVYFLCRGTQVVYVGKSVNVHGRAYAHYDKEFDSVWHIPYRPEMIDQYEQYWIAKLQPTYNVEAEKCGLEKATRKRQRKDGG